MNINRENLAGIYVFEGIDNVGKTTIVKKLKDKINETTEYECIDIAFPGNEYRTLGSLIYHIHHNQEEYFDVPLNETSLQLLHIASHIDLISRRIKNFNTSKYIVLLDRYWWSTYVYGLAGKLTKDMVHAIVASELIYWDDINVKRIFLLERENRQRDYGEEKEDEILKYYRELAEKDAKCIPISNDGSIQETVENIYNLIIGSSYEI